MGEALAKDEEFELPKRHFTVEFWVGIFTIIGLLCFGYLAVNLAGIRLFDRGYYSVTAEFDSISGLKLGAPVEIAGVEVGDVTNVTLNSTSALVKMKVRNDVKLRTDDIAAIRTRGIIGDRFIKISPGSSDELIPPGAEIFDTESPVEFEEIIGKIIHQLED